MVWFILYWASLIIGAGVLFLPMASNNMGFVPLLLLIVAVTLIMSFIYIKLVSAIYAHVNRRIKLQVDNSNNVINHIGLDAEKIIPPQKQIMASVISWRDQELFDNLIDEAGLGRRGIVAFSVGISFFCFFAIVGYLLTGSASLTALSLSLKTLSTEFRISIFILAAVLIFMSYYLRLGDFKLEVHTLVIQVSMLIGIWMIMISLLTLAGTQKSYSLIGYTISVILLLIIQNKSDLKRSLSIKSSLLDEHKVNVFLLIILLCLFFVAVAFIFSVFIKAHAFVKFIAFSSSFSWMQFARTVGLVIFAYAGLGSFNLVSYPQLLTEKKKFYIVVIGGLTLTMVIYIAWVLITSVTLSPKEIQYLSKNQQYTTIGIANKIENLKYYWQAAIIKIFGVSFALLAVTGASVGFAQTIAKRANVLLRRKNIISQKTKYFEIIILLIGSFFGWIITTANIEISTVLYVSGLAGAGLLILVLPWLLFAFAEDNTNRFQLYHYIASGFFILILILSFVGINLSNLGRNRGTTFILLAMVFLVVVAGVGLLSKNQLPTIEKFNKDGRS